MYYFVGGCPIFYLGLNEGYNSNTRAQYVINQAQNISILFKLKPIMKYEVNYSISIKQKE